VIDSATPNRARQVLAAAIPLINQQALVKGVENEVVVREK
jgi:L-lysine 2,3-aminomutase